MRPAQLVTQCVANWVKRRELADVFEVGDVEAFVTFVAQAPRERFQKARAIARSLLPVLLVFDDEAPDLAVGAHHFDVDRAHHAPAGLFQNAPHLLVQRPLVQRLRFLFLKRDLL